MSSFSFFLVIGIFHYGINIYQIVPKWQFWCKNAVVETDLFNQLVEMDQLGCS